ncbi:hypothetical protein LUZ60_015577 [Juncus effusus]|nr:hypothetical protein LUZ60_015577 [Juncus effusus]
MRSLFIIPLVVALVIFLSASNANSQNSGLKDKFYKESCPSAEQIIRNIVWQNVAKNSALPAKFLRMFFHDCFVRGCDASVLIDSTTNSTAEKDAAPNKSLAGFEIIDQIKSALETVCPQTVSCADIVALAARDAVSFQFNQSLWEVQTGRRDGTISLATEALANIPSPFSNFATLVSGFANKNLDIKDLVVLSGAHTIGVGHCNFFSNRLYNFTGKGDADPSLNTTYATFLKTQCTNQADNTTVVPMDPGSALSFDTHYYSNLQLNQGLFQSDAGLLTDRRAVTLVGNLIDQSTFFSAFKNSIRKMGRIGVMIGSSGEIRKNCRAINS